MFCPAEAGAGLGQAKTISREFFLKELEEKEHFEKQILLPSAGGKQLIKWSLVVLDDALLYSAAGNSYFLYSGSEER